MLIAMIEATFAKKGWRTIMAKAKKLIRRAWTKDDVRRMKTMAKAKSGVTKIAKALKRTPGATGVMAAKLGVSLSMRA
jgi:divalent metal cation (Fe/Co/Zn/Cd) transporter